MDHQRVRPDEPEKLVHDRGKRRLASEEFGGQAVDSESIPRHVALGIDMSVKTPTARDMVDQFDAGNLDDPMSIVRIEAGSLSI
jgi:hypothetical protein